jgi:hypothetical protein
MMWSHVVSPLFDFWRLNQVLKDVKQDKSPEVFVADLNFFPSGGEVVGVSSLVDILFPHSGLYAIQRD